MFKNYTLTSDTIEMSGKTLYRVRYLQRVRDIPAGTIGGFVELEDNLSQDSGALILDDAMVYGNAFVGDTAIVSGHARVCDNAAIYGDARVMGYAVISGEAQVKEKAEVMGHAFVCDSAVVAGTSTVCQLAGVSMSAKVLGSTVVDGQAQVGGNATTSDVRVTDSAIICDNAVVSGPNCTISGASKVVNDTTIKADGSLRHRINVTGDILLRHGYFTRTPLYIEGSAGPIYVSSPDIIVAFNRMWTSDVLNTALYKHTIDYLESEQEYSEYTRYFEACLEYMQNYLPSSDVDK